MSCVKSMKLVVAILLLTLFSDKKPVDDNA